METMTIASLVVRSPVHYEKLDDRDSRYPMSPPENLAVEYLLVPSTARVWKGNQIYNDIPIPLLIFCCKRVVSYANRYSSPESAEVAGYLLRELSTVRDYGSFFRVHLGIPDTQDWQHRRYRESMQV